LMGEHYFEISTLARPKPEYIMRAKEGATGA